MVEDLRAKEGSVVEIAEEASVVRLNTLGNLIFSVDLVGEAIMNIWMRFGSGRRMWPWTQPMMAKVVPLILGTLIHLFEWSLPGNKLYLGEISFSLLTLKPYKSRLSFLDGISFKFSYPELRKDILLKYFTYIYPS
ncbi:hypothetical protein RHSIM_Rhsim03G0177900 [Rhododendron simsii]|uniref:Uncharacterized protein n=1 Tax=Rhododendron simsii TaxID=118357 RepID=A0A834LRP2_RHOSS|nr:hypothetical protein RHSIM_Rhsim03G0177900 [Rhododendron simsii]